MLHLEKVFRLALWGYQVTFATLACLALFSFASEAQDQPPLTLPVPTAPLILEYTGKPVVLPFRCSDEDIRGAGLACSEEEPCPVFLEISAAESTSHKTVIVGNIHTESVTLYSVILGSDDGGHSWTEIHERIRGAGLDRIQFFDANTGWITGQELFPLPKDPFILLTTDGGKTWTQRPILSDNSENRFGAIQQFGLSGKAGAIVIDRGRGSENDRYVLFESPDGGENWAIKEESKKPIAIKNAAVAATDWRVRADGPSAAFHVEQRQGSRWSTVAAFAVKLAPCKPPE
jgi:photosystem II stability/assembly factor-like uncharacterized protein